MVKEHLSVMITSIYLWKKTIKTFSLEIHQKYTIINTTIHQKNLKVFTHTTSLVLMPIMLLLALTITSWLFLEAPIAMFIVTLRMEATANKQKEQQNIISSVKT